MYEVYLDPRAFFLSLKKGKGPGNEVGNQQEPDKINIMINIILLNKIYAIIIILLPNRIHKCCFSYECKF